MNCSQNPQAQPKPQLSTEQEIEQLLQGKADIWQPSQPEDALIAAHNMIYLIQTLLVCQAEDLVLSQTDLDGLGFYLGYCQQLIEQGQLPG